MKTNHFSKFVVLTLAAWMSVLSARSATVIWTSGSGTDTNWSNGANWNSNPTPPGSADDVKFFEAGTNGTAGVPNNLVDGSFAGTINSLQYGNSNGFQTTLIAAGQTVTIAGTNGLSVFTPGDPGVAKTVRATITGANGTLLMNAALANVSINQGEATVNGSMGILDLTGLGTFRATINRIGLGTTQLPNAGSSGQRIGGTLFFARTNIVSLGHTATLAAYAGTPGTANTQPVAIDMSYNVGNPPGVQCFLYLGLSNVINVDSLRIGGNKASATSAATFTFNPAFTNQNPTLVMRGISGGSSRVTWWAAGDMGAGASGGNVAIGTNDFSNGTIDVMVDTISLGRDPVGAENLANNSVMGVITFTSGTINANTIYAGNQILNNSSIGTSFIAGYINLNGVNAKLVVNNTLTLGRTSIAAPVTRGFLNVTGGTVLASNILVGATSATNSISLSGATLIVSNALATSTAALTNLAIANSVLGLTLTADSATKAFVGNLNASGATNLLQLNVPVFASYPAQIPVIKYSSLSTFNFGLTNIPASAPGAYLSNNVANKSIDLVLPTDPRPVITSISTSFAGDPGANVNFTVTYTGVAPLFVQWRENGTNVVNGTTVDGSIISGATADTLSITNGQASDSGTYTVVVTNSFGSVTSAPPTVLVLSSNDVVPIVTGPNNLTVIQGNNITLSAAVAGKPIPAVQWQRGGTNIDGAISVNLTITNAQYPADQGTYFLIASNSAGLVTNSAFLTVIVTPVITLQPVNATVTNTQTATFTVAATGVPSPSFQWRKNGNPIPGQTGTTYTIPSAAPSDIGVYSVAVTNLAGSVISSNAQLLVTSTMGITTLSPANAATGICYDTPLAITFSQAPTLRNAGTIKIFAVTNTTTPVDTIDLSINTATNSQLHSLFPGDAQGFQYYPVVITGSTAAIYPHGGVMSSNQTYYVTIDPGAFTDSVGAYFTGIATSNTWKFITKAGGPVDPANPVVNADGSGDFVTVQGAVDSLPAANSSRRVINIRNGTYFELVDISVKSNVTFRGQSKLGTVIKYPNNATLQAPFAGTTHARMTFKVNANDVAIENLSITNSTPQGGSQAEALMIESGARRCVVSGCDISSRQDTILANVNSSQVYFYNTRIYGNFDYMWGGGNLYFNKCTIHTITGTANGNATAARTDTSGTLSATTPWVNPNGTTYSANGFSFVNCTFEADTGVTNITLAGSNGTAGGLVSWAYCIFDTNNNTYIKPSDTLTNQYVFWQYQNTNINLTGPAIFINLQTLTNGDSRLIAVTNPVAWFYGWVPSLAPNILTNPVSQSVSAGQAANFSVLATGIPDPTYQWLKNGSPITGATGASYNILSAVRTNAGGYSVVVSNAGGSVTSSVATLTYTGNVPPVANPASYSRNAGFSLKIAIAGLNWTDADADALSFTTISSTNGAVVTYDANFIYYSNPNDVTDEIDYTIGDGNGGTASSFITVLITPASTNQTLNIVGQNINGDGSITIKFAGIPNYTYWVEATTNLVTPDWQPISTNVAGPNGLWIFTDTDATNFPARYYRSHKP